MRNIDHITLSLVIMIINTISSCFFLCRMQDEVRSLQLKLSQARQQYISLASSTDPLNQQDAICRQLEADIVQYEQQLAELTQRGEGMMANDPKVALPVELNTLHSHWLELQQQVGSEWGECSICGEWGE